MTTTTASCIDDWKREIEAIRTLRRQFHEKRCRKKNSGPDDSGATEMINDDNENDSSFDEQDEKDVEAWLEENDIFELSKDAKRRRRSLENRILLIDCKDELEAAANDEEKKKKEKIVPPTGHDSSPKARWPFFFIPVFIIIIAGTSVLLNSNRSTKEEEEEHSLLSSLVPSFRTPTSSYQAPDEALADDDASSDFVSNEYGDIVPRPAVSIMYEHSGDASWLTTAREIFCGIDVFITRILYRFR